MRWLGIAILVLYSAVLLFVEATGTQQDVRPFFSDIPRPSQPALLGINTTRTAFLLCSTALVFTISLLLGQRRGLAAKTRFFYGSQVLVFLYLAVDERFMVHESIGNTLHIADWWALLAVGAAEACLVLWCGELRDRSVWTRIHLGVGIGFFVLMLLLDMLTPQDGTLRLSAEDLSKTWGATFLLFFAFGHLHQEADRLQGGASGTPP